MKSLTRNDGFTLIEFLIVCMIIGVMGAIAVPNFRKARMQPRASRIGFAVGGAMDSMNFRENINSGYLPLPSAITPEGVFNEYFFDTGITEEEEVEGLFYPTYSSAVSTNPLTGLREYYMSVGLNSNLDVNEFKRRRLNLVVVLDISGSMSSGFSEYYYDVASAPSHSRRRNQTMLEVATENIANMLEHLNEEDSFGLVLFDSSVETPFALNQINDEYKENIKKYVARLKPRGGTNMEIGIQAAINMYDNFPQANNADYENRVIFLTDAMPNMGRIDSKDLMVLAQDAAKDRIHTTFIGIGLAFNTDLINRIATISGANYFSVVSAAEFKERMYENFDYMVCPLVYDLNLKLMSQNFRIAEVFGSPDSDLSSGELMRVSSLFPSPSNENDEIKGGLILLRLEKIGDGDDVSLVADYKMNDGYPVTVETRAKFVASDADFYANSGIRKGVLLARYAQTMQRWIATERDSGKRMYNDYRGIWEHESVKLVASNNNRQSLRILKTYFLDEIDQIGDSTLSQEVTLIDKILNNSTYIADLKDSFNRRS